MSNNRNKDGVNSKSEALEESIRKRVAYDNMIIINLADDMPLDKQYRDKWRKNHPKNTCHLIDRQTFDKSGFKLQDYLQKKGQYQIVIIGHCNAGNNYLSSHSTSQEKRIYTVHDIASKLPLDRTDIAAINLVACSAGAEKKKSSSFARKLHSYIMFNRAIASEGKDIKDIKDIPVIARVHTVAVDPAGKKATQVNDKYQEKRAGSKIIITKPENKEDAITVDAYYIKWRSEVLKVLEASKINTDVLAKKQYLGNLITDIKKLSTEEIVDRLKKEISNTSSSLHDHSNIIFKNIDFLGKSKQTQTIINLERLLSDFEKIKNPEVKLSNEELGQKSFKK